jgi:hypothetical protein
MAVLAQDAPGAAPVDLHDELARNLLEEGGHHVPSLKALQDGIFDIVSSRT